MSRQFDYKPRFSVEYQTGLNGSHIVHFSRHQWDDKPVIDSHIQTSQYKSYRQVTEASYGRISNLINQLTDDKMGDIRLWLNCPGSWSYRSYGIEVEAPNA